MQMCCIMNLKFSFLVQIKLSNSTKHLQRRFEMQHKLNKSKCVDLSECECMLGNVAIDFI